MLYVYGNDAYVRDAKGNIMFSNTGITLHKNDRINGTLVAKLGKENNMLQVVGVEGSTNASGLTISAGNVVKPREVNLEDLTESDYSDYVLVKAVQLERSSGVWAVVGDKRARLYNAFKISGISVPSDITGKYYDIKAIYGTNVANSSIINELKLLESPVEVDAPTGISVLSVGTRQADGALYNLQGQRVGNDYKGLIIKDGKKILKK